MHRTHCRLIAGIAVTALFLLALPPSFAQAPPGPPPPAPIMPPSLPPTHVVNLMTVAGSEALGAKWKIM
jgi:hypothetical protein